MLMFIRGHEGLLPLLLHALFFCVVVTAIPTGEKRSPHQSDQPDDGLRPKKARHSGSNQEITFAVDQSGFMHSQNPQSQHPSPLTHIDPRLLDSRFNPSTSAHHQATFAGHSGDPLYPQGGPPNQLDGLSGLLVNPWNIPGSEVDWLATGLRTPDVADNTELDTTTRQYSSPNPSDVAGQSSSSHPLSMTPEAKLADRGRKRPGSARISLPRSNLFKSPDLSQLKNVQCGFDEVLAKLNLMASFETVLNELYKAPIRFPRGTHHGRNLPHLIIINTALLNYFETPPDRFRVSLVNSAAEYATRLQDVLIPLFNVHQIDLRLQDLALDCMAIWLYLNYLEAGGPDFRPDFASSENNKTPNRETKQQRPSDTRRLDRFNQLAEYMSTYKAYIETVLLINESSSPGNLIEEIKKFVNDRKTEPKAQHILGVLNIWTQDTIPEFELQAMLSASASMNRRGNASGKHHRDVREAFSFKGDRYPTHVFKEVKSPQDLSHDFLKARDQNLQQFEKSRGPFEELVAKSPFSGIKLPLKEIPGPANTPCSVPEDPFWYNRDKLFS
ncbi:hypothetical protein CAUPRSCDRAFT_12211, partial [Caulochytrium protostelioides]